MKIDQFNFAGKKAIVRVDFNVPLDENGKITDDTRIRGALPTLKKILSDGGALIIMSHMGKPKGKVNPKFSLGQIVDAVAAALGTEVKFAPDCAKAKEAADACQLEVVVGSVKRVGYEELAAAVLPAVSVIFHCRGPEGESTDGEHNRQVGGASGHRPVAVWGVGRILWPVVLAYGELRRFLLHYEVQLRET